MPQPFEIPQVPPTVRGDAPNIAKDQDIGQVATWANAQVYAGAWFEGLGFFGYTYLSELAQRPEYRRAAEILATEATRKWVKFRSTSTGKNGEDLEAGSDVGHEGEKADRTERIKQLVEFHKKLDLRGVFRKLAITDALFGRAHVYPDLGTTDDREELTTSIGNGRDATSEAKVGKGSLKAFRNVEPVWCYPADYDATDPLKESWYNPQSWFVQGKKMHATRIMRFVSREVPDLLKPSYMFGGIALSQMLKPYVDNWLRGRQAISNLVWKFSTSVVSTNLEAQLQQDGDLLFKRVALFNAMKNNEGLMLLNKATEEFTQVNTPLGTLDGLQAQLQEHMCSVSGTPVVKLLGIQPAGLNASSAGELTAWADWVEAYQQAFMTRGLTTCVDFTMLSLWGDVDEEIVYDYESIRENDPVQAANVQKIKAETDDILIASGELDPSEGRTRLATDPESGYDGLDPNDLPEPPEGEANLGLGGTRRPPQFQTGGAADAEKLAKTDVDYSRGKGDDRCRNCAHYLGEAGCEVVRGKIDPNYWCEEFERK